MHFKQIGNKIINLEQIIGIDLEPVDLDKKLTKEFRESYFRRHKEWPPVDKVIVIYFFGRTTQLHGEEVDEFLEYLGRVNKLRGFL